MTEIQGPQPTDSSDTATAEDATGRVLGDYILIRRLGRGGMADVYLSQQTKLNRQVAVKILRPELARENTYVDRFHREAQAAAALIQANIVQIYEVGEIDGLHFIAQEYVRGQNLRQFLNRHQIVEPILAVSIIRQVAAALQRACEQGVIHRDIKPENILLAPNGEVKVADFGLARVIDDTRTDLTQIGITMGTPLYMSPEQAEGARVDTRSDIYSLGITAYHMLTGKPPFEGENALAIAVQHVKQDPVPLSKLRPDLPRELCNIVHKMISKRPEDRFQDPAQLLRELRKLQIDDITDWDQLTEKLSVAETMMATENLTVPQSRLEVTRQLESIMTGHFRAWWQSGWLWTGLALAAIAGALAGVLYALNNPLPNPLDVPLGLSSDIPIMDNAKDQYYYAYFNERLDDPDKSEQLWLAVVENFPEYSADGVENKTNQLYIRKTEERLGDFYLRTEQDLKAFDVYSRLASLEEQERRFRLVGWAGLAILYDSWGEIENARINLSLLPNDLGELKNDWLRQEIVALMPSYGPGVQR